MKNIENNKPHPIPITFIAKIARQGDKTRIITVPKKYWESGTIDDTKTYKVTLTEIPLEKEKS